METNVAAAGTKVARVIRGLVRHVLRVRPLAATAVLAAGALAAAVRFRRQPRPSRMRSVTTSWPLMEGCTTTARRGTAPTLT